MITISLHWGLSLFIEIFLRFLGYWKIHCNKFIVVQSGKAPNIPIMTYWPVFCQVRNFRLWTVEYGSSRSDAIDVW